MIRHIRHRILEALTLPMAVGFVVVFLVLGELAHQSHRKDRTQ